VDRGVAECEYNALNTSVRLVQRNEALFLAVRFLLQDLSDQLSVPFC